MNRFQSFNPFALLIYYVAIITVSVFSFNPFYLLSGFSGAFLYLCSTRGVANTLKSCFGLFIIMAAVAICNPIFSHNGATILFFVNDSRITFEALVYGVMMGFMIIEVLMLFRCFSHVFESEKLMYVFGRRLPKLALVLSMTLRFIPMLINEFRSINSSQKAIGQKSRFKRYISSFSAVITRAMENSIITSDSMSSRGFASGKRTFFSRYKFEIKDLCLVLITLALAITALIGKSTLNCYPTIELKGFTVFGLICFSALSFIPFVYEIKEGIRWKLSMSRI